jgi:t-SNARE complex subunit (syntaxin)
MKEIKMPYQEYEKMVKKIASLESNLKKILDGKEKVEIGHPHVIREIFFDESEVITELINKHTHEIAELNRVNLEYYKGMSLSGLDKERDLKEMSILEFLRFRRNKDC